MIKATELRINNWVSEDALGYVQVHSITPNVAFLIKKYESITHSINYENINGIILTPDILSDKCGFVQEGSEAGDDGAMELGNIQTDKKISFLWIPKKGRYTPIESKGLWISRDYGNLQFKVDINQVKYLHQLQNVYFSIMGKELIIKF